MSSQPTGKSGHRVQHLLQVVEENRDRRCDEVLDAARDDAREIVRKARREARLRLHAKVQTIRNGARQQLASAEAARQTNLRLQRHRADHALLQRAWQPLVDSMQRRWQDEAGRRQWIDELVEQASATLVDRQWRVEHPKDWPVAERAALEARLSQELGHLPAFQSLTEVRAGLRICAGSTCVDGTLEGLLGSRARIEAQMLAALSRCRQESREETT